LRASSRSDGNFAVGRATSSSPKVFIVASTAAPSDVAPKATFSIINGRNGRTVFSFPASSAKRWPSSSASPAGTSSSMASTA